jgi:hypothetical protein
MKIEFYEVIKRINHEYGENHHPTLWQTFFVSAGASSFAEALALVFYYPYDLIKTRMQTKDDVYRYRNLSDAFLKILNDKQRRIPFLNLYSGLSLYGFTFISYTMI